MTLARLIPTAAVALLVLVPLANKAEAGPVYSDELIESVEQELVALDRFLKAMTVIVKDVEKAKNKERVSQQAVDGYKKARTLHKQAESTYKQYKKTKQQSKLVDAYKKAREAKKALNPAIDEVLKLGYSDQVKDAIQTNMACAGQRLVGVDKLLKDPVPANSQSDLEQGEAAYKEAKACFPAQLAKAFEKGEESLRCMDRILKRMLDIQKSG